MEELNIVWFLIFCCSISYVFVEILVQPGELLWRWFTWLDRLKLPEYFIKPLGGCIYCTTGQITFWSFLFIYWDNYSLFVHIGITAFAILINYILIKIIDKIL